ncbi:MAG: Ribosomal protein [Candidatus Binatus sp.]|nr:Ribosomal protein [Candidatus Binatus sp.]
MELSELRQMSPADLAIKERETREEIFRLKLKLRTNQLDNHTAYRQARRELARILTLLGQKTSGREVAPKPKAAPDKKRAKKKVANA